MPIFSPACFILRRVLMVTFCCIAHLGGRFLLRPVLLLAAVPCSRPAPHSRGGHKKTRSRLHEPGTGALAPAATQARLLRSVPVPEGIRAGTAMSFNCASG